MRLSLENIHKMREEILNLALRHIVFDGWSWKALNAAGRESKVDLLTLKRAFPKGPQDLVAYFCERADKLMLDELGEMDMSSIPVRERIETAIEVRLRQNSHNREAVRKLLSYFALPKNIMSGVRFTYQTIDGIWYAAGDTSTDYNFYTKRGLLAGIYSSTILYWLADESKEYTDTSDFLRRRVSDVMKIPSLTASLKKKTSWITSTLKIAGIKNFY